MVLIDINALISLPRFVDQGLNEHTKVVWIILIPVFGHLFQVISLGVTIGYLRLILRLSALLPVGDKTEGLRGGWCVSLRTPTKPCREGWHLVR